MSDIIALYRRSGDLFAETLTAATDVDWDAPAPSVAPWTLRDLVGHVTWGRDLIRTCALGDELDDRRGAPGAERAGDYLDGVDPVAAYQAAHRACAEALTVDTAERPAPAMVRQFIPTVGGFLPTMISDTITHTWDLADALGVEFEAPPELLAVARGVTARGVLRRPGFFSEPVEPGAGATEFDRYLADLGRASSAPSSAHAG